MERAAVIGASLIAIGLLGLVVGGRQITATPETFIAAAHDVAPDATATRAAEELELAALRTQVALLATACADASCVLPSTPVVTPAPPPLPMGQPVAYPGGWSVTVTGAALRPTVDDLPGQGPFVQVDVEVTNLGAEPRQFPFRDWVLIDGAGRTYQLTVDTGASFETGWFRPLAPSLPEHLNILFAVTPDAGDRFILESTTDPAFRVQLELAARG